jgi:NADPH-dependent glutamate synthase beta subunit-like oxidoreductase
VSQAARWLTYARAFDSKLAKAVGVFDKAVPHARDIRDMIEHEDEYLTGTGQKQAEYAVPYGGMPSNAHTMILHGDAYLIGGGRIDVQKTIDALKQVLSVVEETRSRLAPLKPVTFGINVKSV